MQIGGRGAPQSLHGAGSRPQEGASLSRLCPAFTFVFTYLGNAWLLFSSTYPVCIWPVILPTNTRTARSNPEGFYELLVGARLDAAAASARRVRCASCPLAVQ